MLAEVGRVHVAGRASTNILSSTICGVDGRSTLDRLRSELSRDNSALGGDQALAGGMEQHPRHIVNTSLCHGVQLPLLRFIRLGWPLTPRLVFLCHPHPRRLLGKRRPKARPPVRRQPLAHRRRVSRPLTPSSLRAGPLTFRRPGTRVLVPPPLPFWRGDTPSSRSFRGSARLQSSTTSFTRAGRSGASRADLRL